MIKLDKTRPFGQVFGDPKVGFEQDGRYFDHAGEIVIGYLQTTEELKELLQAPKEFLRKK